jgi:CheY-like chemotaxis protein
MNLFPSVYEPPPTATSRDPALPATVGLPSGTETVLLVEDDPALLKLTGFLLRRLGYTVLSAASGAEALSIKQQPGLGPVDLLFTDSNLPEMSGQELAERIQSLSPHTRVLLSSGYPEDVVLHRAGSRQHVAFLQKPSSPSALACKLREVLDGPHAAGQGRAGSPLPAAQVLR